MSTLAKCVSCGVLEIEGYQFSVGADPVSSCVYYRFDCPLCGREQRCGATPRVATVLLALGARLCSPLPDLSTRAEVAAPALGFGSAADPRSWEKPT